MKASLRDFSWDPKSRQLHGYSEIFAGAFPETITVLSHHTGQELVFRPVRHGHALWDDDQWDGEQQVYEVAHAAGAAGDIVLYLNHAY